MRSPGIYDKELWALTVEATIEVDELVACGIDRDLAITMLAQIWPEDEIFVLDDGLTPDDNGISDKEA